MSSSSTLDQTRKETCCCCRCRGKILGWGGVRPGGHRPYPLCTTTSENTISKLDRLPEHGEQGKLSEDEGNPVQFQKSSEFFSSAP